MSNGLRFAVLGISPTPCMGSSEPGRSPMRAPLPAVRSVLPLHPSPVVGIWFGRRCWPASPTAPPPRSSSPRKRPGGLGHGHIDPEHILFGLIPEGEGVAVKTLARLGIVLDTLRR
jgi:hypothetical protein